MQNNSNTERRILDVKIPPHNDADARAARPGFRRRFAWALMPADMRTRWTVGFLIETKPESILEACLEAVFADMADKEADE